MGMALDAKRWLKDERRMVAPAAGAGALTVPSALPATPVQAQRGWDNGYGWW